MHWKEWLGGWLFFSFQIGIILGKIVSFRKKIHSCVILYYMGVVIAHNPYVSIGPDSVSFGVHALMRIL